MNKVYILLILIVIFAFSIRIYKIDSVPPALTWDEVAVGYNAWTIANYGRDEYGSFVPVYFRSFGEDKQPVHIYLTALFVKFLGLSDFSTRLPAAVFGALNVFIIFYLAKIMFNNSYIGLLSSFFLAISPQNIHFSRFNHEANFALAFFMLGLLLFLKSFRNGKIMLIFSFLLLILSMLTYHAAEVVIPPFLVLLMILFFNQLKKDRGNLLIASSIILIIPLLVFFQPRLLGINRFNQTVQGKNEIEQTPFFQKTHNSLLGRINLVLIQYSWHFDPKFLFISGDKNPRLSSQGAGEFYKIDILFLVLGTMYILFFKRSKVSFLLVGWALLGPLPSSLVAEAPHAGRTVFMMGSWHIISALGTFGFINLFRNHLLRWLLVSLLFLFLVFSLSQYLNDYLNNFSKRYGIDWQYGMKQMVEYIKEHPEYNQIYTTAVRSQPYIFFLYYLQTPLVDYLNTVIYNNSQASSSNNVSSFEKYSFGGWNSFESPASYGVLYVLSPSEYDGLVKRSNFDIKKIIYYPNDTVAFYIVSLK